MANDNLYIADLPAGIDDDTLQTIFSAYGVVVQHKILPNPQIGWKTAAMIRFQSVEEAQWIVENLNGNIPQGLSDPVKVRFADTPAQKAEKMGGWGEDKGFDKGYGKGKDKGYGKDKGKGATARAEPYGGGGAKGGDAWGAKGAKGGDAWGAKGGDAWGAKGGDAWGAKGGGKAFADPGKGNGKGKGKSSSIKVLTHGLLEAQALPGSGNMDNDTNALYIAGLPNDTQDLDLYRIFAPFGAIAPKGVRAMVHPDGSCKGFGFVNYLDASSLEQAMATLNGTQMPDGNTLTVKAKDAKAPE